MESLVIDPAAQRISNIVRLDPVEPIWILHVAIHLKHDLE